MKTDNSFALFIQKIWKPLGLVIRLHTLIINMCNGLFEQLYCKLLWIMLISTKGPRFYKMGQIFTLTKVTNDNFALSPIATTISDWHITI